MMKTRSLTCLARTAMVLAALLTVVACASTEGEPVEDPLKNDLTGPQTMGAYWRPF